MFRKIRESGYSLVCHRFSVLLVLSLSVWIPACSDGPGPVPPSPSGGSSLFWWPYQPGSWGNTHHDPGLSDYTENDPSDLLLTPGMRFVELEGDALFTGMSFDDVRDRVYVTTGKADPPNLYAFNMAGQLQWTSAGSVTRPLTEADQESQPDAGAISGTAIVDVDGNLYLCDTRYLWSYSLNGQLRWRTALPVEGDGKSYPFITPFFTRTGQVGGVTAAGRVLVYDRDLGKVMKGNEQGYRLPGIVDLEDDQDITLIRILISKLLWNTCDPDNPYMIDPKLIAAIGAAFLGVGNPVANAPAVLPDPEDAGNTRVYVASRLKPEQPDEAVSVRLFRVDVTYDPNTDSVTVAADAGFDGLMPGGEGCATSPTLSRDGTVVYAGDNNGTFYAFHTDDGSLVWPDPPVLQGNMLGSPTATRDDGSIYVATDRFLHKILPDGTVLWARSYNEFAQNENWVKKVDEDGDGEDDIPRVAIPAGLAITSPNRVLQPFTLGYMLFEEESGVALWPTKAVIAVLDRDGNLAAGPYEVPDTVETTACADRRGNVYVAHASSLSSVYSSLYCKLHLDRLGLPVQRPIAPVGGLTLLQAVP